MDRKKLNFDKIRKLPTANEHLDQKYGKEGTPEREQFKAKAIKYFRKKLLDDN